MDAIGPINPPSENGNRFILTTIDYCTKWPIALALPNLLSQTIISFIVNEIVKNYGIPLKIISNRCSSFVGEVTTFIYAWFGIKHSPTTPYRPQSNCQVEMLNQ
ncbi:Pro-Pol polyprotein [Zancudomyces culisetae]|uniref:Pro-Pol polyprotein n=1 Tax=Zancudomyces culisetae TaxID=1213189 RepID=A0A1R1PHJ3_ZANCU|nr:Pro-Pol polyprotein [Zancudomyces culisetae]|eukprot:OMH80446.1 Pro-Pol polyprotein [Zancudomyces culisetae]